MNIRKIAKFEFEDGTDIEFAPTGSGTYEVWVNGVFIEVMERGLRPGTQQARYYYETQALDLPERLGVEPTPIFESAALH